MSERRMDLAVKEIREAHECVQVSGVKGLVVMSNFGEGVIYVHDKIKIVGMTDQRGDRVFQCLFLSPENETQYEIGRVSSVRDAMSLALCAIVTDRIDSLILPEERN